MSERARASVALPLFWATSVAGALLLMLHSIHRREPIVECRNDE